MLETISSVAIGFIVALLTQLIVFPFFDIQTTFGDNFMIAAIFTVVSVVRGYFIRRLFNWLHAVKGVGNPGYYVINPKK